VLKLDLFLGWFLVNGGAMLLKIHKLECGHGVSVHFVELPQFTAQLLTILDHVVEGHQEHNISNTCNEHDIEHHQKHIWLKV
jgi:hypothetical protein